MELEKILEEIIEQLKAEGCIIDDAAGNRAEEIVRQHMNDNSICADCSRRKWYQIGFKDGLKSNDDWISVEESLPERTLDEKINKSYKKYLVFIDSVDGWDIDMALYDFWNDKKWREAHDGYGEIENVIAWRSLPEPYRPERSERN